MAFRAALAALFICAGCGGSDVFVPPLKDVPVTPRAGLTFGYYFGDALYMPEQKDQANLWWVVGDFEAQIAQARSLGLKNIVIHLGTTDPVQVRALLSGLSEGGHLIRLDSITVYAMDEPDKFYTDQEVRDKVGTIRQILFDTPGLLTAKIGVFYGCETGKRPGIKSFDLVGCFRYESSGCAKLETDYASLRSQLSPGAKLWMIPGGASINGREGNQDPACWANYAHRNADVWGVIGFMWQSGADPNNVILGIRENGLAKRYCETGKTILGVSPTC